MKSRRCFWWLGLTVQTHPCARYAALLPTNRVCVNDTACSHWWKPQNSAIPIANYHKRSAIIAINFHCNEHYALYCYCTHAIAIATTAVTSVMSKAASLMYIGWIGRDNSDDALNVSELKLTLKSIILRNSYRAITGSSTGSAVALHSCMPMQKSNGKWEIRPPVES